MYTIDAVNSVTELSEPGVFVVNLDYTDKFGNHEVGVDFVSRSDDPYGLGPQVRQWLIDNDYTDE